MLALVSQLQHWEVSRAGRETGTHVSSRERCPKHEPSEGRRARERPPGENERGSGEPGGRAWFHTTLTLASPHPGALKWRVAVAVVGPRLYFRFSGDLAPLPVGVFPLQTGGRRRRPRLLVAGRTRDHHLLRGACVSVGGRCPSARPHQ